MSLHIFRSPHHPHSFFHRHGIRVLRLSGMALVVMMLAILAGCAPRGESRSVEEVLKIQRDRFAEARKDSTPPAPIAELVGALESKLKQFASPEDSGAGHGDIADALAQLTTSAGFTSRPALTEITGQYRAFPEKADLSSRQLLAARTFSILAAELESTAFAVSL